MGKINSVNTFRVLAIIFVLVLHTSPFEVTSIPIGSRIDLALLASEIARFAVPLFFILSGYFWSQKIGSEDEIYSVTTKIIKRFLYIFIAWSLIYLLPTNIFDSFDYGFIGPIKRIYWNSRDALRNPIVTLMQGTKVHLWFLVSLIFSMFISAFFLRLRLKWLLIVVAVMFYILGIAGKAYSDTLFGFHTSFNFRNGPFFSLIFFVTGYLLQHKDQSPIWFPIGLTTSIVGLIIQFTELVVINKFCGTNMFQDYVVGTYFFGLGIALVALSNNKKLYFSSIQQISPLVLGIYASHFIIIDLLTPINRYFSNNIIWDITYIVVVFIFSSALTLALNKFKLTKRLVS